MKRYTIKDLRKDIKDMDDDMSVFVNPRGYNTLCDSVDAVEEWSCKDSVFCCIVIGY